MPIVPSGSTNLNAIGVPNVYVQIVPPNPLLNGVPTDIVGTVGTAIWGPKNSPTFVGSMQEQILMFGNPQTTAFDLGTAVYAATLQNASNFVCVRVTDGTDLHAAGNVVDVGNTIPGAILTALYSGTLGNSIRATIGTGSGSTPGTPTYRLSIFIPGQIPEIYDNIGGSGSAFWTNLVNAINNGQSIGRGPSQLVVASLPSSIGYVNVTIPGIYTTLPTATATIGTGATFQVNMQALSASIATGGAGYTANDVLTIVGGTSTTPAEIIVDTVDGGGVILTAHAAVGGLYTVLPSNPVSVIGGTGAGATFNMQWLINSITVLTGGTGYTSSTVINISGSGGGAATAVIGSNLGPSLTATTTLSGGTDGSTGVTAATLIGVDGLTRTGMYALRGTKASIGVLADVTDTSTFTTQATFGLNEGIYMIGTLAPGYQDNISGAITAKQAAAIDSYAFKLMFGDWEQIQDPFNSVTRYISPQGFVAGKLSTLSPEQSSLNKPMGGIINTQKTAEQKIYSDSDLLQIIINNMDLITKPIPASDNNFGCRLGVNTSSNPVINGDNYPRMINFLAETLNTGMGRFIGLAQTPQVQLQAKSTIENFLQNLATLGVIGNANPSLPAFKVILDSTNNPPNRVALGYMQADVQVTLFSIIVQFIINLEAGQSVTIQVSPPQQI